VEEAERVNILLVDDRWENLVSLKAVLDNPGYNLVKACSGREALRRLLELEFALILLDVQMPILDGFDTAALIKKREHLRHIPIIFITGMVRDEPLVFKGYESGAVDYIVKPFDPGVLRSKVAVFAELHRKNRQLAAQAELLAKAERRKLEHEGLKREAAAASRYRDLVDGIRDGIVWALDVRKGESSYVSPQVFRILGYHDRELRKRSLADLVTLLIPTDEYERVNAALKVATEQGHDTTLEHRCLTASGGSVWLQSSVKVVKNEKDEVCELRGLSVDVSRLKAAEDEARKAVALRDEFLSIASHELKTPLTPLKLQIQLLRRLSSTMSLPGEFAERVPKMLEISDRQVTRLNKLVDELLDVTRISSGKLALTRESFDLHDVVEDICGRFALDLKNNQCDLRIQAGERVTGNWDRLRVEQAFTNLLTNAMKYASGKPVDVEVGADSANGYITVRDQGPGIAKSDQERIFNRFERATSWTNIGGLGLGLYIVNQIVKAHGGEVKLASEPGAGATFTMALPIANA
jgi:PAS domain S-box-containing protein